VIAPNQPPEAFGLTVPDPWVTGGIVHGISQTTSLPNWLIGTYPSLKHGSCARNRQRGDQRGAAICHAFTVRDEQGPGLVAAEEILVGADEGPAASGSAATDSHRRSLGTAGKCAGRSTAARGVRLWAQFWSHSLPSGGVHRCPRPLVRAGQGRSWTVVNSDAQYSKACEGATLPWVQIPPPPPLTCDDASHQGLLGGGAHRGGLSFGPQMVSVARAEIPGPGSIGPELRPCTAADMI
jgi:hypothetical protein